MNHDAVPSPVRETAKLTSSVVPFADLPGQSRLFLDYIADPGALREFYPNAPVSFTDLTAFVPEVLEQFRTDRDLLCEALVEINTAGGSSAKTQENIDRLRHPDTVAVVTGQQTGLFTGPLYTIYKALTAIRTAERLRAEGVDAVPVFWAATEDHDIDEVSGTTVLAANGGPATFAYGPDKTVNELPVGTIILDDNIRRTIEEAFHSLPQTEFSGDVRRSIEQAWQPGSGFGLAFERQIAGLFAAYGLIVVDPLHASVKALASPLYAVAAEKADTIAEAVRRRGAQLRQAGYHEQVLVDEDYFPLFWHNDAGQRLAVRRTGEGIYRVRADGREFSRQDLIRIAHDEPARLSPGVMLRPVVQDHLFPTVCYVGGGAEIAYFAQNSEVYRELGRPVTPIIHRQSFTVIEAKQRRVLERFGLTLPEMFEGIDAVLLHVGKGETSETVHDHFSQAMSTMDSEMNMLRVDLEKIDTTLIPALEKRRSKIAYHLGSLRKKAYLAQARKDRTAERQIRDTVSALVPNGHLQERVLNVTYFLNKYGPYFIDWLYSQTEIDERSHKLLYI